MLVLPSSLTSRLNSEVVVMATKHIKRLTLWSKDFLTYAHRVKLHLVSSQCPRLIRKDVMDHSKVFDYAHVSNRDASAALFVDHSPVEVHVVRDVDLEELHGDEKRSGQEKA